MKNNVEELFGHMAKMVGGSKSMYRRAYPENLVVFNGNVCTEAQKIWYGDVDVTLEKQKYIDAAKAIDEPIYILREMDARFENEEKPLLENFVVKFNPDGTFELGEKEKDRYTL